MQARTRSTGREAEVKWVTRHGTGKRSRDVSIRAEQAYYENRLVNVMMEQSEMDVPDAESLGSGPHSGQV